MDVSEKLDIIISLLKDMNAALSKQIDIQNVDHNPWPYKLIQEMNSCEDSDGNGIIYGRDFIIRENLENVPAALHSMFIIYMKRGFSGKMLTWEEYADSLPAGDHKDKVVAYIATLNPQK